MRIAITGGNGDMGSSLIPYLMENGHSVVSMDRFLPPVPPVTPPNVPDYIVADITDFGQVVAGFSGCDAVIHLAAHRSPLNAPAPVIYSDNTIGSYNVLFAAATLGINNVCMASSVNAIGSAFSRSPRYDYFPIDENHPTYAEDPYSLSKWVLEKQADSFALRYESMKIASLRFHWLLKSREIATKHSALYEDVAIKHLWAYTLLSEANRACLLALTADFSGHENFYIASPITALSDDSADLAKKYYPNVPIKKEFSRNSAFLNSSKASRILGWHHTEN